jgi:WD40 repeat protein
MDKKTIFIILCISILGIILSPTVSALLSNQNQSWKFILTNDTEEQFSDCAMSDNGDFMVVGSENDNLYLFQRSSGIPLWKFSFQQGVYSVDISSDGKSIVAGGGEGIFYLFNGKDSNPLWKYSTDSPIYDIAISSDGKYIAVCSEAGETLSLFHRDNPNPLWQTNSAGDQVRISSDGNYIISYDRMDGIVYFFDKSISNPLWQYSIGDVLYDLAITPNADLIVTGGQAFNPSGHKIYLFTKSGTTPKFLYTEGTIRAIAISQNGDYVAAGCSDGIYLFNASSLTRLWKYPFPIYADSHEIAISPDGNYIITNIWRDPLDGEINRLLFFNKSSSVP